jgi:hypothetical protein
VSKRSGLPGMDYEPSELERTLLGSAEADGPTPAETERAWREFRASAGALAALSSSPPTPSAPLSSSPTPNARRAWFTAPRARALQWLSIGAIGGGSLVAFWRPLEPSAEPPPPLPVTLVMPAPGELAPDAESGPAASLPAPPAAPLRARPAGPPPRSPHPRRTAASPASGRAAASVSHLAREVAALDAARTALAIGANAEVLQQIEEYHRQFPGGALAADADVVAIEALAAEGNPVALARAVQRFLRHYPRDPHVARVRELESAAPRTSGH